MRGVNFGMRPVLPATAERMPTPSDAPPDDGWLQPAHRVEDADASQADETDAADAPARAGAARTVPAAGPAVDDGAWAALIARIAARDQRALETLYDSASARVYGLVHRFTRRRALTEEVVEDTFWQIWRQAPRYDGQRGRALAWVLAMARSRAIDALRREQRFRHESMAGDDPVLDQQSDGDGPHDLLDATRGVDRLHRAIAALEPRARQLIGLAFLRGMTHEEIAAQSAMPLGSVKSIVRRALQQLRSQLQALESL